MTHYYHDPLTDLLVTEKPKSWPVEPIETGTSVITTDRFGNVIGSTKDREPAAPVAATNGAQEE